MKEMRILVMIMTLLMNAGALFSLEKSETLKPQNSYLSIGGNYTRVNFKPNGEACFNGNLGGLQAAYGWRPSNSFFGGLEFQWRQGSMHGSDGKRDLIDIHTAEKMGMV